MLGIIMSIITNAGVMTYPHSLHPSLDFFLTGMGINVTNSEPTISVNEIISQYNKEYKTNLEALTIEGLMARTINLIEAFIDEFQEHGTKPFLKKYYSKWLHRFVFVIFYQQ